MKKVLIIFTTVFIISSARAQWVQTNGPYSGSSVYCLSVFGTNIFAGAGFGGVHITTNNGINWTLSGLNYKYVYSLAILNTNIFAGTGLGMYLSTNNGTNWTLCGMEFIYVKTLAISGSSIFAGTYDEGVYLSTNNGANWTAVNFGLTNKWVDALAVSGSNIYAGTGYGVFLSINNGTSWTLTTLRNVSVRSLAVSGNNIFAGTANNGVYLSTNNSASWTQTALKYVTVYSLAASGNNIFAGTENGGVYLTKNNGGTWLQKNEGIGNKTILSLLIANNYIFAGTEDSSAYRRLMSDILNVNKINSEIPDRFYLHQNYPNPFNPKTKIKFDIRESSLTKLIIYDILGKEVTTLVNEKLNAGGYKVNWDARHGGSSSYPSGVYLYKIETKNFSETKRMVLIK